MSEQANLTTILDAIDQNPDDVDLYKELGSIYLSLGQFEKALSTYQSAFKLDPQDVYIQNSIGNVYLHLQSFEEAISAFQKAIALAPYFAYLHHNLGNVYAQLGRFEEAIAANKQAIAYDPNFGHAFAVIASSEKHLGRQPSPAIIAKCRELIPENDHYNRACIESVAGNVDMALLLLNKVSPGALKMAQTDPDFVFIRDDTRFQELINQNN